MWKFLNEKIIIYTYKRHKLQGNIFQSIEKEGIHVWYCKLSWSLYGYNLCAFSSVILYERQLCILINCGCAFHGQLLFKFWKEVSLTFHSCFSVCNSLTFICSLTFLEGSHPGRKIRTQQCISVIVSIFKKRKFLKRGLKATLTSGYKNKYLEYS